MRSAVTAINGEELQLLAEQAALAELSTTTPLCPPLFLLG